MPGREIRFYVERTRSMAVVAYDSLAFSDLVSGLF